MIGWPEPQPSPAQAVWREAFQVGLRDGATGGLTLRCDGPYPEQWSAGYAAGREAAKEAKPEAEAEPGG
jgi:hypothetical protein